MTKHDEFQTRLKVAIHNAILDAGTVEGTNDVALTNTDVVEALLEIAGFCFSPRLRTLFPQRTRIRTCAHNSGAHQEVRKTSKGGQDPCEGDPTFQNQLTLWQADLGERLGAGNLGSRYDPSSVHMAFADKKIALPLPLWSPCASAAVGDGCDAPDRHEDYLSVCRS